MDNGKHTSHKGVNFFDQRAFLYILYHTPSSSTVMAAEIRSIEVQRELEAVQASFGEFMDGAI